VSHNAGVTLKVKTASGGTSSCIGFPFETDQDTSQGKSFRILASYIAQEEKNVSP
jgi:hypothetical protein